MKKSIFSIILALVMVAGMITAFSINASAVDNSTDETLPEVSISMGKFICYDNKQEALASVAHSKLKSPPDDDCFIYASMDQSTNTITIAERSKVLRFDVGYVPITTSIAVPANTSYSVTYTFEVKCGRVCDSDVTAMAELFDFGTTDASSSLKFNTDTKSNNSSSSSSAYSKFRTTTTTSSTKIGTYEVTVIYENDTNEVKTFSSYFGFFAGVRKTYEDGNQHKLSATCAISTAVDKLPAITFDTGDGGTVIAPITQEAGTAVTAPADPTRANYIFAGWDQDIPATMPEEDMTITALWIPNPDEPTVFNELFTFQCTEVEDHSWCVNFRTYVTFVNNSAKYNEETGYWEAQLKITSSTFGWVNDSNIKAENFGGKTHHYDTSSYTFDVYYDPEYFGLNSYNQETTGLWLPLDEYVFDVYCYTAPAMPNLDKVQQPENSKAAAMLWVRDADIAFNNQKYAIKYTIKDLIADTYTVGEMYTENGEFYVDLTITDIDPYIDALIELNGKDYYLPDWEYNSTAEDFKFRLVYSGIKSDYVQDGTKWKVDASSYPTAIEEANGINLWLTEKVTVTYTDGVDDVELFEDQEYTIDTVVETGKRATSQSDFAYNTTPEFVGDPTRTGYTFAGWAPEVAETVTKDVEYVARWGANDYVVKFYSEYGYATMKDQAFTYDVAQALNENEFLRTGYTFVGWAVTPDGEAIFADGETVMNLTAEGTITLYAVWKLKTDYLPFKTYLIYTKDAEHGEISVARSRMPAQTTVVIKVKADKGYELDTLSAKTDYGYTVPLYKQADGTYTFKMPMAQVNITATFKEIEVEPVHECPGAKFEDLSTDAWYHEGVDYMIENNLMNGVSDTKFSPDTTLNRAMIATILWRLEGEPKVDFEMSFTDVEDGQWYTEAIRWAASCGIVEGFEDGTFKPTDAITRQQLALMIYRYAESKDADVAVSTIPTNADAADVADWAKTAVYWAIENGIYVERDGAIEGLADATRAEAAVMIWGFCQK